MRKTLIAGVLAALAGIPLTATAQSGAPTLTVLGTYATNLFDAGGAEIPAYDPQTQRVFVVNGEDRAVDVLDISNPASPTKVGAIDVSVYGQAANSVAVKNGLVAAAIEAEDKTQPGVVVFFDTASLAERGQASVGALPDMVTFSPDGRYCVVANEGEPNDDYSVDPEGSVSIVRMRTPRSNLPLSNGSPVIDVRTATFTHYNSQRDLLISQGVRIFGPNATVAQDLEPEYIAFSADSRKAYVTLQENNAIAEILLPTHRVKSIRALGTKDHSLAGNGFDASDKDDAINIANWPVQGYFLPDSIVSFQSAGQTFLITANEGDAREYDGFEEESRIKDLTLDPTVFPDAATLQEDENLGRLAVTTTAGDTDGDGDFDQLYSFGARSFTIWTPDGQRVFDSGDQIEQITASILPDNFNADNDDSDFDSRSDAKGPEPEGLAVGEIDGHTYAFVGLERVGGVMIYDVSNPHSPVYVDYVNNRNFSADPETAEAGDLGPEGLHFVPASKSPNGQPLLIVANEISGTTTVYAVGPAPVQTAQ